jgi:predicted dinucleotide-binding enzyme
MRIAVIGAGNVGSTLVSKWLDSGHEVAFGVRRPGDKKYEGLAQRAAVTSVARAVADADVVVLATPWSETEAAIASAGELSGKTVVDCTNPLEQDLSGLSIGHLTSGGELVASWAKGAKVVKAFNTTGANIMADPVLEGRKTVMFVCGDDADARATVAKLSDEIGFDTIEAGELKTARLLEPWALIWISMAYRFGFGRDFGFCVARR